MKLIHGKIHDPPQEFCLNTLKLALLCCTPFLLVSCGGSSDDETPAPRPLPQSSPSPTVLPSPTALPSPTVMPTPVPLSSVNNQRIAAGLYRRNPQMGGKEKFNSQKSLQALARI
jgi:hypothetical protein